MNISIKLLKLIPMIVLVSACTVKTNESDNIETASSEAIQTVISSTEVSISNAWVREPAPGQKIGAAYMTLTSPEDRKLVYVEAAASAGAVEIHSMSMNNGIMKMRMLDALTLEANQPKALEPGGFHLMMFDLKKPLKANEDVTFRLCFEDPSGKITHQNTTLKVKAQ